MNGVALTVVLSGGAPAAEAGFADFVATSTAGLVAPMGSPSRVIQKLTSSATLGCEALDTGPAAQIRTYNADIKLPGEAARLANFRVLSQ